MPKIINNDRKKGFAIIEMVITLAGIAILATSATDFLFSILSQRDQAVSEAIVTHQPETVFPVLGKAIRSAQKISIEDSGRRLKTTNVGECFTFAWNPTQKVILFGRQIDSSCVPPENPTARLTPNTAKVTALQFQLSQPNDSGKNVQIDMDVSVYRPFWKTSQHFSQVFINVID